ncbi:efflux RND transporter periplasmic adaptor subunit [Devosia nitrariae]|uniref:Secretion protein HlyD n=1 Tax=Devosia nitrariae TaxID=2071872 RepID=A0ABQ5W5Q4_9HYPH|nr:efflux RND transporter periplasmic adaptor subunit [Devosia nitrariae]GLQ55266.1 secretion protein HlyD [Devosia nitrariae]
MRKLPKWVFDTVVVIGIGWLGVSSGFFQGLVTSVSGASTAQASVPTSSVPYRLANVEKRVMVERVSATGTLNPVALVSVSSQVSGQVQEIYADFNDEVKAGDPIALIDPITFQIAVDQAEADLDIAAAGVATQEAAVDRMAADLETVRFDLAAARANSEYADVRVAEAAAELERRKALGANAPRAERERAESAWLAAQAQLRSAQASEEAKGSIITSAEAQLRSAQAQLVNLNAAVRQREAALRQARLELERTVIRAPVDGIVTIRSIEIGTTVAVSLQAPTLFTIAQNMREMQVNTAISEGEIGRIHLGQRLEFTVDAYPKRVFSGEVVQIRMHPQTTQNVVNYTVVASAPNQDLLLMPGMTATSNIIINETEPVLAVLSSALRFRPPGEPRTGEDRIYVLRDGRAESVAVLLGTTDGPFTAIHAEGIDETSQVILGVASQDDRQESSGGGSIFGLF